MAHSKNATTDARVRGTDRAHRTWYRFLSGLAVQPDLEQLSDSEVREEHRHAPTVPPDEAPPEALAEHGTAALLRLAQGGSPGALSALMERYHPRILEMVRRRLGRSLRSGQDSTDVAQDVVAESLRSLEGFRPRDERSFAPWLGAIVENRIRNLSRLQRRRPARSLDAPALEALESPRREDSGSWEQRRSELDGAIENLRSDHREVVRLRYREGLSYRQIGKRMGRSEAAVSMLLSRARVAIARALTGEREA